MICPECGANCWRNEVDVGVGVYHDGWKCSECYWDEDIDAFPMNENNWNEWLDNHGGPDAKQPATKDT